jgi:nicotinate-nucleotide pyrophosphorylase
VLKLQKNIMKTEASGNVNLRTVKSIAATGVDRIQLEASHTVLLQ